MYMNTHESYVSLETAKLLKQAGFTWECSEYYKNNNDSLVWGYCYDWNSQQTPGVEYASAPTLEVAQRWLREVKECAVIVMTHNVQAACVSAYVYCIYPTGAVRPCEHINGFAEDQCFDTYEEALEAGIQRALTMLLGKQK